MENRTHLGNSASVGLIVGTLLGARESLVTLAGNAFVQPSQYFLLYIAVPILTWMVLAVLILAFWRITCVVLRPIVRLPMSVTADAGALAFAGTLSILVPWSSAIRARLSDVGFDNETYASITLAIVVVGMAIAAALLAAAIVALYLNTINRALPYVAVTVLCIAVLLLVPVLRFFLNDWKWGIAVSTVAPTDTERPNLLLISIDTLRADHLGRYGGATGLTPNMDLLADGGVTFRQTISSSPWTLPAMASLLTALHPRHHRAGLVTNRRDPLGRSALPENTWTLAEELRRQGYRTHAIVTNPYLALSYGLGAGFETYESVTIESEIFLAFRHTTAFRLLAWLQPRLVVGDRGETVSARASKWLEASQGSAPFFLWVHYIDPHAPYSAPGVDANKTFRTDSLFGSDNGDPSNLTLRSPDIARLRSGEIRLSAEEKDLVRGLYRAEVHAVDAAVGTVLNTLEHKGLRDDTLVAVVADHGEELWEHGSVEHGHTLYDELLLIPFILRWHGSLPASREVDALVRIVDVAPTILDLLNVPIPQSLEVDGESAVPLIQGLEPTPRIAVAENMLFAEPCTAIRTPQHKYIRWEDGREEVYDLTTDSDELVNLVALPELVEPLRTLSAAMETQKANRERQAPRMPAIDPRTKHALEALGYLP